MDYSDYIGSAIKLANDRKIHKAVTVTQEDENITVTYECGIEKKVRNPRGYIPLRRFIEFYQDILEQSPADFCKKCFKEEIGKLERLAEKDTDKEEKKIYDFLGIPIPKLTKEEVLRELSYSSLLELKFMGHGERDNNGYTGGKPVGIEVIFKEDFEYSNELVGVRLNVRKGSKIEINPWVNYKHGQKLQIHFAQIPVTKRGVRMLPEYCVAYAGHSNLSEKTAMLLAGVAVTRFVELSTYDASKGHMSWIGYPADGFEYTSIKSGRIIGF